MFWRRRSRGDTDPETSRPEDGASADGVRWDADDAPEDDADTEETDEELVDAEYADDDEEDDEEATDGDLDLREALAAQAEEILTDDDEWMYGANAPAIVALLDRLEDVGPDDADALYDAWREVPRAEREVARRAVRQLVDADTEDERHARSVREAVGNWVAAVQDDADWLEEDADWPRHCSQAGEIVADAGIALVFADELDELDFTALYSPWANAIEAADEEAEKQALDEAAAEEEAGADGGGPRGADGAEAEPAAADAGDEEETGSQTPVVVGAPPQVKPSEFGPNGQLVSEFLNRLWLLPAEQVTRLIAAWEAVPRDQLERAHDALHDLVDEDPAYRRQVRRAQDQLVAWLNGGHRDETNPILGRTGLAATHRAAGPALADAVAALVLGDLLDRKDAETLYRPWYTLIGAPPLPEPSEGSEGEDGEDSEDREAGAAGAMAGADVAEAGAAEEEGEFGPNTDLVLDLLERVDGLKRDQVEKLADAWTGQPRRALEAAHEAAADLTDEDPDWRRQVDRARGEATARAAMRWSARLARGGDDGIDPLAEEATNAIADAVAALVLVDLLEANESETLYRPWAEVVGSPALPEPEDAEPEDPE